MQHYPRYCIFVALLLTFGSLRAAVIREDFARMVDYAGWQLIDAYMQDYVRLRPDMTAEKEGFELFQETYNSTNYSEQNPPNSEAIRLFLISHSWRNAGINLYAAFVNNKAAYQNDWTDQRATEFLQQKISAVNAEALGAQSEADYRSLQATKERLIQEVAENFEVDASGETTALAQDTAPTEVLSDDTSFTTGTTSAADVAPDDTAAPQGFTLPTTAAEDSGPGLFGMLDADINPILLGAMGLLLLLLLYLFSLFKRLDNRIDKHSKRIEDLTTRLFLKKDPISTDDINRLKSEVTALQKRVEELTPTPVSSPKRPVPAPTAAVAHVGSSRSSLADDQEEYYLSTPNSDGTFNASSMSQLFRPSASVYKFRVSESNGTQWAEFTVANDYDAVKDALSSPSSYLDPVCESVNSYFSGAKRVINVQPGRATKRGNKWVVKPEHKARIRYE